MNKKLWQLILYLESEGTGFLSASWRLAPLLKDNFLTRLGFGLGERTGGFATEVLRSSVLDTKILSYLEYFCLSIIMDISLLGSYTRFSCSLIKWNMQRAKITIPHLNPLYLIPFLPFGWTKLLINEINVFNLNWRQFLHFIISTYFLHPLELYIYYFPLTYIHMYFLA